MYNTENIKNYEKATTIFALFCITNVTSENLIVKVELYIDGKINSSQIKFSKPYLFTWIIPDEPDSTIHTLQAKAYE